LNVIDCVQQLLDKHATGLVRLATQSSKGKPALLVAHLTALDARAKTVEERRGL